MAKISDRFLRFDPVPGADGYRVYYQEGGSIDQQSSPSVDVGLLVEGISMHDILGDVEANFEIGVVPYDNAGNEGDLSIIVSDYPFDFVPPVGAVTGGEIYSLD